MLLEMMPPLSLPNGLFLIVAGTIWLFGADRICRMIANRSPWNWYRRLILHPAYIRFARVVGIVAILWGAIGIVVSSLN